MSSKIMMVRSYGSSIRSLIQTHIRPAAAAATIKINKQPPVSIYTGLNAITRKPVIFASGFCSNAAAAAGGDCGNDDLNDIKNEDYDSDEMDFVFETGDDDDDVDDDDENDDDGTDDSVYDFSTESEDER